MAEFLRVSNIPFQEQMIIPLKLLEKAVGRYFADFLVAGKIIIEIKKGNRVNRTHMLQLLAYLKALKLPLGILAYFGTDGVSFHRVLNEPSHNS